MQPKANQPVHLLCRFAFLFLAFAVFSLGLQARLALYRPVPDITVTSAKLNTENHSAQVLRTIATPQDDKLSGPNLVDQAMLIARSHEPTSAAFAVQECSRICESTQMQLSVVATFRRPPPFSI